MEEINNYTAAVPADYTVCMLLVVWGKSYIDDFLRFGLPSLLANGNIPALITQYKTRFVFLTREDDARLFENNPAFQKLSVICEVEFMFMDDLIVLGNYSTTITLAYDAAIRKAGNKILQTYFLFLVADYVMADGSLEGLVRYIKKGYSGICSGNFQVVREGMEKFLLSKVDQENHVLQVKPRELLKESFNNLHLVTIASIYNQSLIHDYRANRFFYAHDEQILAGRFYLLHMLCIRPEITNYKIGAACDYSFIQEMCPSGNVAVIKDSDDYLVVEVQSKKHELKHVDWHKYDLQKLAFSLADWTTKRHRENAEHSIYFHTRDISLEERRFFESELDAFTKKLAGKLKKHKEKSHFNHPFWLAAINIFNNQKKLVKDLNEYDYYDLAKYALTNTMFKKLYYRFFGMPPTVFRWHFRWHEYRTMMNYMKEQAPLESCNDTVVLYSSYQWNFMRYFSWLKNEMKMNHQYHVKSLLQSDKKLKELTDKRFGTCLFFVKIEELANIHGTLKKIKELLEPKAKILMIILNNKHYYSNTTYDFKKILISEINPLFNARCNIVSSFFIYDNLTLLGAGTVHWITKHCSYNQKIKFLFYVMLGVPGIILTCIVNCLSIKRRQRVGHCTSAMLTLVPNEDWEVEDAK